MSTEKRLLSLKKQMEESRQEVEKLKTKKEMLMEELEEKWNCKSIKQATVKADKMKEEISELQKQLDEGIAKLEEEYEF